MCKRYDHKTLQHKFMVCANTENFEKLPCGFFFGATWRVMSVGQLTANGSLIMPRLWAGKWGHPRVVKGFPVWLVNFPSFAGSFKTLSQTHTHTFLVYINLCQVAEPSAVFPNRVVSFQTSGRQHACSLCRPTKFSHFPFPTSLFPPRHKKESTEIGNASHKTLFVCIYVCVMCSESWVRLFIGGRHFCLRWARECFTFLALRLGFLSGLPPTQV